jgi:D-lactate dehydrogenase
MAELIDRLGELARRFDVRIVNFGHAGNGNIHVNLLGDLGAPAERARMHDCLHEVFRAVLDLGGTLSGEHGIGFDKKAFVGLELEPATLEMMRRIKRQFDPAGILNPDKLFPDEALAAT